MPNEPAPAVPLPAAPLPPDLKDLPADMRQVGPVQFSVTQMHNPAAAQPDLALAEPDLEPKPEELTPEGYGAGVSTQRPILRMEQLLYLRDTLHRQVTQYAILMRAPTRRGPGTGGIWAMAAEKIVKWMGKGYVPFTIEGDLWQAPVPPPPKQWVPSMIDDAIRENKPIPEDMAPLGYRGPIIVRPPAKRYIELADGTLEEAPPITEGEELVSRPTALGTIADLIAAEEAREGGPRKTVLETLHKLQGEAPAPPSEPPAPPPSPPEE